MKSKVWLMVILMIGILPLTGWSQREHIEPDIFMGPEFYIRYYLVAPIKPKYPMAAQEAGIQGKVLVLVWYDGDGNFVEAKPLRPSPDILVEAVTSALKESRIKPPGTSYPKANYFSEMRFLFTLEGEKAAVADVPESEQHEVSKEFNQESKKFKETVERGRDESPPKNP